VISGNRRVESKTDRAVKWRYFVQLYEVTVVGLKNLVAWISHTHTHSVLTAIFPGEPGLGLVVAPLILLLHLFLDCASFLGQA